MVATFPLPKNKFFDTQRIFSATFWLSEAMEMSQTGGGEILTSDHGPRLWRGTVSSSTMGWDDWAEQDAVLSLLREPGRSFLAYPVAKQYPRLDPEGEDLGSSTPTLGAIPAGGREVRIQGLPRYYRISAGDFFAFSYGSAPVRYALHQFAASATANGSGVLAPVEITPRLRPGAASGAAVSLIRPFCKAIVVPGSYRAATAELGGFSTGSSFDFIQTLR